MGHKRLTHQDFVNRIQEKFPGFKVLGVYVDDTTPLVIECNKGHKMTVKPHRFTNRVDGCHQCRNEQQICKKCGTKKKPYKNHRCKDGLQWKCPTCQLQHVQRSRAKLKSQDADAYKKRERYWNIKRRLGISRQEYEGLVLKQQTQLTCEICGSEFDKTRKEPYIDHCHDTGVIRGLLCASCNFILGLAKDNTETLQKAIQYLINSRS